MLSQLALRSRSLFAKLALLLGVGTVLLFWLVAYSLDALEQQLSQLSPAAKTELLNWRDSAQAYYLAGNEAGLQLFLAELRRREQIWAAVADVRVDSFDHTELRERFTDGFILGRSIDWPIHLYQAYNPVMDLQFQQANARLLVELPARLRPGRYWPPLKLALQLLLPLSILLLTIYALYQHLMQPLRQLQQAARALQHYNFHQEQAPAPVCPQLGNRQDELTDLAASFDQMAQQLSSLIISQRRLLADLSHELRTPLTRLQLALEAAAPATANNAATLLARAQRECQLMRQLVENTLTLAQLSQLPAPPPVDGDLCLTELLEVITDNARFEYPAQQLQLELPARMPLRQGNILLLGQALENILRNALRFNPAPQPLLISAQYCRQRPAELTTQIQTTQIQTTQIPTAIHTAADAVTGSAAYWLLTISDHGPGVPPACLTQLFQPFFRVPGQQAAGFGLGLALASRQISACGGWVSAHNRPAAEPATGPAGLTVSVWLPAATG